MKKSIFIIAIIVSAGLVSCKKDYTCNCTFSTTEDGTTVEDDQEEYTIKDATKLEAKTACIEAERVFEEDGTESKASCELKKK